MALYLPLHFIPRDKRTKTTGGHWSPPVCVLEAKSEVQKNPLSKKKKKKLSRSAPASVLSRRVLFSPPQVETNTFLGCFVLD